MKLIPSVLKKTTNIAKPTSIVQQQNNNLLKEQLKTLDTFVSSQAPVIKTSQKQALSKIEELSKTVAQTLPKK